MMRVRRRSGRGCWTWVLLAGWLAVMAGVAAQGQKGRPVEITVHAEQRVERYRPLWDFFGADEPNFVYAANGRKLLRELSELGEPNTVPVYFRPHNLFTTGDGSGSLKWGSTNVYTETSGGKAVYDWTITDRIFDAMKEAHVRPVVELGFMPEAMSTHPEPYRHKFPEGDVFTGWSYPPKDYAKWGALVSAYADHLKARYGAEVDGWLWEVWNEPDIAYWHGTAEEYDRLYDFSTAAVRSVLPRARIGGPESTGVGSAKAEAFLRQFLEHCAKGKNWATGGTGAPLDFISYHPKGRPTNVAGSGGAAHVRMDVGHQLRAIERGMRVIAEYPEWRKTPIVLGENDPEGCAACRGAENGYRNGPLYGVSEVEVTMRTYELARKYGLTVEGSVTWAFEFEDQPYFAGFRELATNGVDKPVLNAFRMMGMLGGEWVKTESSGALSLDDIAQVGAAGSADVNAVATRKGDEVDVLVWNYHDDDVVVAATPVKLRVDGMEGETVEAEEFRMDASHSNSYAAWMRMGSPQEPTETQKKGLEAASKLERSVGPHAMAVEGGSVSVELELPRQAVVLVRLRGRSGAGAAGEGDSIWE